MADYSFLSDTDDSAVEDLISQATDLSILEQVAAINCSAFSDSVLPTELETRFRKLKSFPSSQNSGFRTEIRTASAKPGSGSESYDDAPAVFSPAKQKSCGQANRGFGFSSGIGTDPEERNGETKKNLEGKFSEGNVSFSPSFKEFPEESFTGSRKNSNFSPSKRTPTVKKNPNWGSLSSPSSDSSGLSRDSPSPPRKAGCFFCSPKKKSKKNQSSRKNVLVSDLSIFSEKSRRKILKKAIKEEEKINREAEKIVKWAKQASARMNISDIEDEWSGDEKP